MPTRFFSEQPINAETVQLAGQEHHHLAKVMRLREGECITLFDGSGDEYTARIDRIARNSVDCAILEKHSVDRELPFALTLVVALPKGDRQQWLIEKAVELGACEVIPLTTKRGVAQPQEKSLSRLQRWVISASKQCRRNRLMKISSPIAVDSLNQIQTADDHFRFMAHPSPDASKLSNLLHTLNTRRSITVIVGPEGGFTDDEVQLARDQNTEIVSLGDRILRIETAAIAIASAIVFSRE